MFLNTTCSHDFSRKSAAIFKQRTWCDSLKAVMFENLNQNLLYKTFYIERFKLVRVFIYNSDSVTEGGGLRGYSGLEM